MDIMWKVCEIFILLNSVLLLAEHTSGTPQLVQLTEVDVPTQRPIGSNALLRCLFLLFPPATLYSVKWYKDGSEFFRYLPGDTPAAQAFPLPGITVDISDSNAHLVILNNLQIESSGVYVCEVSTEAPSFHTVSGQGTMTVTGKQ
ncbi:hypothetical protein C0J52_01447 [Blattella germanica]|nr:hypothetical protein C0J52_01447 [Blattella germanica]